MDKKNKKKFSFSKTIAFELVALNTHFYQERTVAIGSQCVKKHSQDFRYYYDRSFWNAAPSGWPKKITNLLPWRCGQCLRRFNMLTVHMCFNTGFFGNSNNHAFCSVLFRKYIRYEAHLVFFSKCSKCYVDLRNAKKISGKYFEFMRLLGLNCLCLTLTFTEREYLSSRVNRLINSLKNWNTTETEFFE